MRAHEPFLAGLTEEGRRSLSQSSGLRTLDVGMIRLDGSELWPDEARESLLEPFLAPMSLSAQLEKFASAPAKPASPKQRPSLSKPNTFKLAMGAVAQLLAAAKQAEKK